VTDDRRGLLGEVDLDGRGCGHLLTRCGVLKQTLPQR
jgi:hypothetical protein